MVKYYDLTQEITEMESITDSQRESIVYAHDIIKEICDQITFNYHEHSALCTALDVLSRVTNGRC